MGMLLRRATIQIVLLALAIPAFAQTTGSLGGTVKDAQGGIIPGVTVELTSETKGSKVPVVLTNGVGDFLFVNLAPDTYRIQVSISGFRPLVRGGVLVSAGDRLSLGTMTVQVAGSSESITVTSEAPLLQAQTGDRTYTATQNEVDNLPLGARSFVAMALLAPGTMSTASSTGENDYMVARVGAGRADNAYFMDGASMMDTGSNRPVLQINTEAISEVRVMVSGYQAEHGRATGLIVSGTTRSGSNQFHGAVYDVERNSAWNANSKLNILNGDPKPVSKERDYGFTLGGPVGKPGGGNKLFFFFSLEMDPRKQGETVNRFRVPTALERAGDFSRSLDNNGALYNLIRDPNSPSACTATVRAGCFQAGGVLGRIPANRLYGLGLNILNWYPMPNVADVPAGQNYNFESTTQTQSLTSYQPNIRVDYQASEKLRLAYRYSRFQQSQHFVTLGTVPGFNDSKQPQPETWSTTLNVNYSLNEKTFLEGTFGMAADYTIASCPLNSGNVTGGQGAEFCRNGIVVNPSATRQAAGFADLPQINPDANILNPEYYVSSRMNVIRPPLWDGTRLNYPPGFSYGSRVGGTQPAVAYSGFGTNPTNDISVSLTRISGAHSIKVGSYRTHVFKTASSGSFGTINFQQDTVGTNPFDTSFGFANAAIGSFSSFAQPKQFFESRRLWVLSEAFVQDTWKATRRLSLDFGIRFSNHGEQRDVLGQQSQFDFDAWKAAGQPLIQYRPGCANGAATCSGTTRQARNPVTGQFLGPNSAILIGTVFPGYGDINAGVTPVPGDRSTYSWPALAVGPRFGVAYDPFASQRTIFRGGVGLFLPRAGGGTDGASNPGQNPTTTLRFSNFQGMGGAGLQPVSTPAIAGNAKGNLPLAKSAQWNVGVQQIIKPLDLMVDASYVGVHGWGTTQAVNQNGIDLGSAYLNGYQDPTLSSTVPGGNFLPVDLARPYRGLGNINITGTDSYQDEWNHSLQFSVTRRLRNGLSLGFNDTIVLKETTNVGLRLEHAPDGSVRIRDDQKLANTLLGSAMDRRQILKANFVWQLPKLEGEGALTRTIGYVVNDWQLAGVWTADTGRAYTVGYSYQSGGTSTNLTGSPDYAARVRIVGDPGAGCSDDPYRQFVAAAFQGPTYNSDGLESGAGYLRTCFRDKWDFSISRTISLRGGRSIALRADFFNAFNASRGTAVQSTMQLGTPANPDTILNLPYDATGAILPARTRPSNAGLGVFNEYQVPRAVQLQARFRF